METTITTCGWVLFGLLTAALTIFAVAFLYGCGFLGYRLSSRLIRERKWWKKAVRQGDHRIRHLCYRKQPLLCRPYPFYYF
ncbi:MAG: hypothetical protein JFT09_05800 [Muribaculaceae bacterium]|nr:hypothetical protein [Muribaculaceae bacterium]